MRFNNVYQNGPQPQDCRAGLVIFNGNAWIVSNTNAAAGQNTAAMNAEIMAQAYPTGSTNIAA